MGVISCIYSQNNDFVQFLKYFLYKTQFLSIILRIFVLDMPMIG